jgi:hypothetical protein
MKRLLFILICLIYITAAKAQLLYDSIHAPTVLLEMFSSEGCSSCPSGDKFMQQIIHLADSAEQPVFVLDYHVDIWDHAGWKDRYSDSIWTKRQRTYMERTRQPALFTPMLVINGKYSVPAGDKKLVGGLISHTLKTRIPVRMDIMAEPISGLNKGIKVNYALQGRFDSTQLVIVLAHKEVTSDVTAGENAGQKLVHHHVVKKLESIPIASSQGSYDFYLDDETYKNLGNYLVMVFLQHRNSWRVYATEQINFGKGN